MNQNGEKKWKKVEVNLEEHMKVPKFHPTAKSSNLVYDECFDEYMSKIAMEQLPQDKPLWELHVIKYPTSSAPCALVFKLHHALGDGYSLMGALLSCLQRADNPSLPFTIPSTKERPKPSISNTKAFFKRFASIVSLVLCTILDFGWSALKSNLVEDDITPIRSCADDFKLRHISSFGMLPSQMSHSLWITSKK